MFSKLSNLFNPTLKRFFKFILKAFLFLFLVPYAIFYIYTFPLRMKESYSRDIIVKFIYKGEEYKIQPTVTCINYGPTINEGSMEWYSDWGSSIKNTLVKLDGGMLGKFWINAHSRRLISDIFEITRVKGSSEPICGYVLNNKDALSKIDRFMKFNNKKDFLEVGRHGRVEKLVKNLDDKKYQNNSYNIFSIRGYKSNDYIDVDIKSIDFGEQITIRTYDRYLPFF